jgi:UDP-N-acetylmuramoyl-L-alanyl-D-glutamate--2,6-diaminopimelate ligase
MQLANLAVPELNLLPAGTETIEITSITADSRAVTPGALFAALPGSRSDGTQFVPQAIASGAVAILAPTDAQLGSVPVPVLRAEDPRRALALMAARFYGRQPETAVAVTGTNGKTSVVEFTRQIYAALGRRAASLGTIGLVKPDGGIYGALTTPDPVSLHRMLAELSGEDVTHVAFEASSHGLDQRRLDGVELAAAAFLNLGRDHLDYHPTVDEYFAAKLRLFDTLLAPGRPAIVNTDDPRSDAVIAVARGRGCPVLTVGWKGETLRLGAIEPDGFGQRLHIFHGGAEFDVHLPLLGAYQASNALVAAALAIATGEDAVAAIAALENLRGVKGRLDVVGEAAGGLVVVDYAHKPEALEAALQALRPFAKGKLICVFGCGGDRDRGKRPIMGKIAVDNADMVIVTDDNPRSEKPEAIRAEILAGAAGATEIGDRAAAIAAAVDEMDRGDVVLIAGKGHETGQIVGNTVIPFSDHDEAQAALSSKSSGRHRP